MRVAVLGGGNGSFAAAGDLALAGHQVQMWRRDRDAVASHCTAGRAIQLKDFRGQHTASVELVTTEIAAAVSGSELILCPTPAFAQADIAELLGGSRSSLRPPRPSWWTISLTPSSTANV